MVISALHVTDEDAEGPGEKSRADGQRVSV